MIKRKRPIGLIGIVVYKAFSTCIFIVAALTLLFTLTHRQSVETMVEYNIFESKLTVVDWILNQILNLNSQVLWLSLISVIAYAIVTIVEIIGLWFGKSWARPLILVLVGISIPVEFIEIIRAASLLKLAMLLVNAAVFGYLLFARPIQENTQTRFRTRNPQSIKKLGDRSRFFKNWYRSNRVLLLKRFPKKMNQSVRLWKRKHNR